MSNDFPASGQQPPPIQPPAIQPVAIGVTAIVGRFAQGPPNTPVAITSVAEATGLLGPVTDDMPASQALAQFFANGGQRLYAVRVAPDTSSPDPTALLGSPGAGGDGTGLHALAAVDDVELVCLPEAGWLDPSAAAALYGSAAAVCEESRRFLIVDIPAAIDAASDLLAWARTPVIRSRNAALYAPWVRVGYPPGSGETRTIPASGAVAGVCARTAASRGVWSAPAGTTAVLHGVEGLEHDLGPHQDLLNPVGVNLLRALTGTSYLVWGARTLAADGQEAEWRYVPVRRTALFIERSLTRGLAWAAFEPNDTPLWLSIRSAIESFLHTLWRQGGLQGATPRQAYFAQCGFPATMTAADIDAGVVVVDVGVALLRPSEFVLIRLRLSAGQEASGGSRVTEVATAGTESMGVEPSIHTLDSLPIHPRETMALRRFVASARRRPARVDPRQHIPRPAGPLLRSTVPRPRHGPGPRLLFSGPAGTGKTMAARVIAAELGLPLFRIDVAAIVNKYIGETEKNLADVLRRAEAAEVVLLFDEADALFGRRAAGGDTDLREREAGREAEYALASLLKWLASHPGIVILATEDAAAVRRAGVKIDAAVTLSAR